tara:strand:+ start:188364 stop:189392 length:1029 start_codon:yes stop_codon:yes gene_type:complete
LKIALTDLAIKKLKYDGKQVTYWDRNFKGFGLRLSPSTKSFVIMKGVERKLVTLCRYPETSLKDAKELARIEMAVSMPQKLRTAPDAVLGFLRATKKRIAPSTYRQYKSFLETFNFTGDVKEIDLSLIRSKLQTMDDTPYLQNYAYASLRAFLNWCLREGIIDKNPLASLPLPNKTESRERVLSNKELKAIWKHTDNKPFGHIIRLLMLTGQRKSEITNLTADNITDVMTFPTKKNRKHVLPITPMVAELLPAGYFNGWSKSKKRLDKNSGTDDWRIHDLRRTFATNCAKLGVPIHITELILDHRTGRLSGVTGVYNRYSYLKEMEQALLTHEEFIKNIVDA